MVFIEPEPLMNEKGSEILLWNRQTLPEKAVTSQHWAFGLRGGGGVTCL
jgi:hypothetical protein